MKNKPDHTLIGTAEALQRFAKSGYKSLSYHTSTGEIVCLEIESELYMLIQLGNFGNGTDIRVDEQLLLLDHRYE